MCCSGPRSRFAALGLARFGGWPWARRSAVSRSSDFDEGWTSLAPTLAIAFASALLAIALFAVLAMGRDLGGAAWPRSRRARRCETISTSSMRRRFLRGACAAIVLTKPSVIGSVGKRRWPYFLAALAGYAAMFVAKWVLALLWFAVAEGRLVLPIETGHVNRWTGSAAGSEQILSGGRSSSCSLRNLCGRGEARLARRDVPVLTAAAAVFAWVRAGARRTLEMAGAFGGVMVLMALMADTHLGPQSTSSSARRF